MWTWTGLSCWPMPSDPGLLQAMGPWTPKSPISKQWPHGPQASMPESWAHATFGIYLEEKSAPIINVTALAWPAWA